jgi:hypothetical protein
MGEVAVNQLIIEIEDLASAYSRIRIYAVQLGVRLIEGSAY